MNIRRWIYLRLVALLLFQLFLTGCGWKAVAEGEFVDEFELKSLIGSNKDTVRGRLGNPDRDLEGLENDYYIYYANGKIRGYVLYIPLPAAPLPRGIPTFHCAVLEFDKSGILRRHDTDWWGLGDLSESSVAKCLRLVPEETIERYDWKVAQANSAELAAYRAGPQETQKALVQSENLHASGTKMEAEKALFAYSTLDSRLEKGEGQVAWKWLCLAANLGNSEAQNIVAHWHRSDIWKASIPRLKWAGEAGIQPDNRVAYMWYSIAARNGDPLAQFFRSNLESMTEEDISQAEQMVQNWEPGQCPKPN